MIKKINPIRNTCLQQLINVPTVVSHSWKEAVRPGVWQPAQINY